MDILIQEFENIDSLKNDYKIEKPKKQKPQIIAYNVHKGHTGEAITEHILAQNVEYNDDTEIEVINSFNGKLKEKNNVGKNPNDSETESIGLFETPEKTINGKNELTEQNQEKIAKNLNNDENQNKSKLENIQNNEGPGEISNQLKNFNEAKNGIIKEIQKDKTMLQITKNHVIKQLETMEKQILMLQIRLTESEAKSKTIESLIKQNLIMNEKTEQIVAVEQQTENFPEIK